MADFFLLLQAPWIHKRMKETGGERKEGEKSSEKTKTSKGGIDMTPRREPPFYRQGLDFYPRKRAPKSPRQTPFGIPKNSKKGSLAWIRNLVSHTPKNSPRKIKKKSIWC